MTTQNYNFNKEKHNCYTQKLDAITTWNCLISWILANSLQLVGVVVHQAHGYEQVTHNDPDKQKPATQSVQLLLVVTHLEHGLQQAGQVDPDKQYPLLQLVHCVLDDVQVLHEDEQLGH